MLLGPKLFTAKRFVDTKNLTQAEWLEVRAQRASVAVIVPQPVVSTRICRCLELWMIKTGRIQQNINRREQ